MGERLSGLPRPHYKFRSFRPLDLSPSALLNQVKTRTIRFILTIGLVPLSIREAPHYLPPAVVNRISTNETLPSAATAPMPS